MKKKISLDSDIVYVHYDTNNTITSVHLSGDYLNITQRIRDTPALRSKVERLSGKKF